MNEVKNVPELRFPDFINAWSREPLSKYFDVIDGDRGENYPKSHEFFSEGHCLFLNAKNVTKQGFSFSEKHFISESKDNVLKKGKLERDDIVLTTRGSVGFFAFYSSDIPYEYMRINSGMVLLRSNSSDIVPEYFYKFSSSPVLANQIKRIAFGSAQPQLTVKEIKKFKVSFSSVFEQQKIADFLSSVDKKIEQLTEKHRLLTEYKKGVMQQIFTQQIRFKDNQGNDYPEWEEVELGEALDYLQPTKYLVKDTDYSDDFSTPVLTAGKTFVLGYTNEKQGIFKELLPAIIFDDFTTAFKYVDFPFKAKSSAMKILIAKDGNNIKYLYEAMQTIRFEIGGHERHWISKFSKLPIPYPAMEEQQKIANFLIEIDNKIDQTWSILDQTKAFKKALLQKMFV